MHASRNIYLTFHSVYEKHAERYVRKLKMSIWREKKYICLHMKMKLISKYVYCQGVVHVHVCGSAGMYLWKNESHQGRNKNENCYGPNWKCLFEANRKIWRILEKI